jgi:hypothetical protein
VGLRPSAHTRKQDTRPQHGVTFGHFYNNWQNDDYRKLVLNAIVWSAHIDVPKDGIQSVWVEDAEVDRVLGPTPDPVKSPLEPPKELK